MKKNIMYYRPNFHFYKIEEKEKKVIDTLIYAGNCKFMTLDEAKQHKDFEIDEPNCLVNLITKTKDAEKIIATVYNPNNERIYLLTEQGKEVFEKLGDVGIIWTDDFIFDGLNKI